MGKLPCCSHPEWIDRPRDLVVADFLRSWLLISSQARLHIHPSRGLAQPPIPHPPPHIFSGGRKSCSRISLKIPSLSGEPRQAGWRPVILWGAQLAHILGDGALSLFLTSETLHPPLRLPVHHLPVYSPKVEGGQQPAPRPLGRDYGNDHKACSDL